MSARPDCTSADISVATTALERAGYEVLPTDMPGVVWLSGPAVAREITVEEIVPFAARTLGVNFASAQQSSGGLVAAPI